MIFLLTGIFLIGAEMLVGTFWLLAIGVASLLMAALTLTFPEMGVFAQCAAIVALGVCIPQVVKRLKVLKATPDAELNKPLNRYVGQSCVAESAFVAGRGRVVMAGTAWNAVIEGDATFEAGQALEVISAGSDGVLKVKLA